MSTVRAVALVLLGTFFILAGANHFWHVEFYLRMMPPWIPAHALLVQISGICEMLGGIGVLVPRTRRFAGYGLIALLIAVFPANLQMAQHPQLYADIGPAAAFFIRLPIQLLLVAWVWWAALR